MGRPSDAFDAVDSIRLHFCKIDDSRGLGHKPFKIVERDISEYTLQHNSDTLRLAKDGEFFKINKALTYHDAECIQRSIQFAKDQNQKK